MEYDISLIEKILCTILENEYQSPGRNIMPFRNNKAMCRQSFWGFLHKLFCRSCEPHCYRAVGTFNGKVLGLGSKPPTVTLLSARTRQDLCFSCIVALSLLTLLLETRVDVFGDSVTCSVYWIPVPPGMLNLPLELFPAPHAPCCRGICTSPLYRHRKLHCIQC